MGSAGDTLVATTLGGDNNQGLRTWANTAGTGGAGSYLNVIDAASHAATKASNLGDVEVLCSYALVGGRVWNDANGDGIQNGADAGIAGITLELFQGNRPLTAPTVVSATTDAQGRYLFAIPPNANLNIRLSAASRASLRSQGYLSYTRENAPGSTDTTDSDASQLWGYLEFARPGQANTSSAIVPPWRESDARSFDIGLTRLQPTGHIGDRVWSDIDGDGVQDTGEGGIPGIFVTLTGVDSATLGSITVSTTTDINGTYLFNNLPPGRYQVRFAVPAGMRVTLKDQGGDDTRDSDADAASNYDSAPFDLGANQWRDEWDFGLIGTTDVAVSKAGPATVAADQTFSYSLTARNLTVTRADGVVVADTLPAGLVYVSASPGPTSRSGQSLTWSLGALAGNGSRAITVNVRAPLSFAPAGSVTQRITNCASITTNSPDSNPANNSACAGTDLQRPEVAVTKVGPAIPALVGEEYPYTLTYTNSGSLAAINVTLSDVLPVGLTFVRFTANPQGCTGTATSVSCGIASLAPGASGSISFLVRSDVATIGASVTNTATISMATPGDSPGNNTSSTTTAIQFPNPGLTLRIDPSPLPVGEPGRIMASYRNTGTGLARTTVLTVTHDPGPRFGAMPAGCTYTAANRRAVCALGDLAAGATGTVVLPMRLPATPDDATTFAADTFSATAEIGSATPERVVDQTDNTAIERTDVIRPNPRIAAVVGPADEEVVRMSWGSAYYVTVRYENKYLARPSLTRAAENAVLVVRIPDEAELLSATPAGYQIDPNDSKRLIWQLGTLAPEQAGSVRVALRTNVPVNSPPLHLTADISTTTYGDDLTDNHGENDTIVVAPPEDYPALMSALQLAIHSELDPKHGGTNQTDGVYYAEQDTIAWPAGEVLDFSPRLTNFNLDPPPFPLEYRARILHWRMAGYEVNGRAYPAPGVDSRGLAGCRQPGTPFTDQDGLTTCAYPYIGADAQTVGKTLDSLLPARTLLEPQMATQGHVYWTKPVSPPMRPDVSLFTVDPFEPVALTVAVDVEVWTMNFCPDIHIEPFVCGTPIEEPQPPRAVKPVQQTFIVKLLVPWSVVGPGGVGTTHEPPR